MKMLARAALLLSAAPLCVTPAMAQHATTSAAPSGYAPEQACVTWSGATIGAGTLVPCPAVGGGGGSGGAVADVFGTGSVNAATANAAYPVIVANGQNVATITMSGLTASGATLTLEGSNDNGATWTNAYSPVVTTGELKNTFTADGSFSVNTAGRTRIRLRVSATGTGTVNLTSNLSVAVREVRIEGPILTPYDASYVYKPAGSAAENSTAASGTFSSAGQNAARAWYATCPTNTITTANPNGSLLTVTDVNGGTRPVYVVDGNNGPFAERIASFAGNATGCTIGLEF